MVISYLPWTCFYIYKEQQIVHNFWTSFEQILLDCQQSCNQRVVAQHKNHHIVLPQL